MKLKLEYWVLAIILLLGFIVRLYKIDNPIADWHSWRQADTAAVTRNFFKFGIDILHPRYDDFSDVSGNGLFNPNGYRFVEFPIFNLTHYVLAKAFPQKPLEFWGRMTSVLAALSSAAFLFFIVRRHVGKIPGLLSAAFYLLLPYNIYFTRVILPDPTMVALYLASLNFFDLWIKKPARWSLVSAIVFGALAVLVKPVAGFFLLPAAWQAWQKYHVRLLRLPAFYFCSAGVVVPFLLWRAWEYKYPEGIPASIWLLNGNHIRFKGAFFQWIFGERIGNMILGKWGTYAFISGIIASIPSQTYLLSWLGAAMLYLFTFATGNVQHDYYQTPIIPSLAVLLSLGVVYLWKTEAHVWKTFTKRAVVIVTLAFMFAFSWYTIRGDYQINHWEIVHAGQAVDRLTPKDAVVVAPYNGDTAFLYQTNRRGFAFLVAPIKDLIDRYNATYYVSVNYDDQTNVIINKYTVVEKNPEFVIVKLVEPVRP
jgi:hypothetical protein